MKAHTLNRFQPRVQLNFCWVHRQLASTHLSISPCIHSSKKTFQLIITNADSGSADAVKHALNRTELKPRPARTGRQQNQLYEPSGQSKATSSLPYSRQRPHGQSVPASKQPRMQQQPRQQNAGTASQDSTAGPTQRPAAPVRVLGVDYGPRWTGVALGDNGRREELQVLEVDPHARGMFARQIVDLALKHKVQGIVVGLPLDPYNPASSLLKPNSDSEQGRRCRHLAHALTLVGRPHNLNVYLLDEANTSKDALRILGYSHVGRQPGLQGADKVDKKVDTLAASLLLQRYFEKPGRAVRVVVRGSRSNSDNGSRSTQSSGGSSSSDEAQLQEALAGAGLGAEGQA